MYMTVLTMKWDGDSGKFARTAAGAFIVSVGLEPVASDMGLFHGRIASIIAVAVPGGGLVFQLALSAGGIGYVLRCGGSIESGKEVARVCSEMFDLFEVKDTLPIDVTRFT